MEKNYYEILEVDKNASEEIIEKAYKTLAKKYHPDLQESKTKKEYEEKMKLINEAYAVLSDDFKKSEYDKQLQDSMILFEEYQKVLQENMALRQELEIINSNANNNFAQNQYVNNNIGQNWVNYYNQQVNNVARHVYKDTYKQDTKKRPYKFHQTSTVRIYIKVAIYLMCVTLLIVLITKIPFIKKWFADFYENNIILKAIVNTFVNTFEQLF